MQGTQDLGPLLGFLDGLAQNNNKVWFEEHRGNYDEARSLFAGFIDQLIDKLRKADQLGTLTAADCVMRQYRDVRFSKDKSPYRDHMGASIAPGGRKSPRLGYYVHIAPRDQSFVAGGLYMPSPAQLASLRHTLAEDAAAFKKLTGTKAFTEQFGTVHGEKLKTAPKGYERTHPEIELLQYKQMLVSRRFSDEALLASDFLAEAVKACKAMRPFLNYLEQAAGPSDCGA